MKKKLREVTINGETKTVREWADLVGVNERTIYERLRQNLPPEELLRPKGVWEPTPKFNEHYFDVIDDEHKAYWLGFIWADGYLGIRNRTNRHTEYNLKLSLNEDDYKHLEKFNKDINGSYEIHYYESSGSFSTNKKEARLFITNQYLGELLSEKYGIIPHRTDCNNVLNAIPDNLMRHFLRGILDADGSFLCYQCNDHGYMMNKYNVDFSSNTEIVNFVQEYFIKQKLINDFNRKLYKRHEGRDGDYITLKISGKVQAMNVLNFLYKGATIYLDRKYKKYQDMCQKGGCNNEETLKCA